MRRAVLTLLAGGLLAQALPMLLGPLLTRLYTPAQFGTFHLFAAVAANLGVVACLRYEFALPVARDDADAAALNSLCRRLLAGMVAASALAAAGWAWQVRAVWPLWLPLAVAALGGLSLATLLATRAKRFRALAAARVLQHGGGAALQAVAGLTVAGVHGLVVGPIAAALAAWGLLRAAAPGPATLSAMPDAGRGPAPWRAAARRFADYPLLNTPHAFLGALQDTVSVALVAGLLDPAAAGAWGLALRYLKAPATLVGGAVSQALHPRLAQDGCTAAGRRQVVQTMGLLGLAAAVLVLLLWLGAPALFTWAFGTAWAPAGDLARALAVYIGLHFVASPLGVVTLAWNAQAWALRLALAGQLLFTVALATGLALGGLTAAGWAVSGAMALYFGWYFFRLATWPVPAAAPAGLSSP
ncbi:MAG TPA: polysaccharide biosynthesis protein [Aquabacterium sp.]|nr:polysaccharide biosynthesis protein [Aquabacterium sp.]HQC98337.1 polysaccharide biosynthesis protein [Aquabacterium sp.]